MSAVARVWLAAVLTVLALAAVSRTALAQEGKSAALAKELSAALDAAKLDSIAAKDSAKPDVFYGALYFPGTQLLVVSAQYSAPLHMNETIGKKEFREAYLDLSSASVPGSKVFIEDLGANGLVAKPKDNEAFDAYEMAGKRVSFDGDWKKQQLSEEDYMKAFSAADERYSQVLAALIAQAKKTS
jgi:hypothetical protein